MSQRRSQVAEKLSGYFFTVHDLEVLAAIQRASISGPLFAQNSIDMRGGNLLNSGVYLKRLALLLICLCPFLPSFVSGTEDSLLKIGPPLDSLKTTELHDSFNEMHHGHRHEAIDIMRPRGTPIRAVTDGIIRKVFISRQGGLTIYEFDRESAYCFYYAHLDRYAEKIHEGAPVARGDVIGYVGTTGDAQPDAPQLHFAIFKLGPDKSWWKGEAINPYPILMRAVTEAQSVWVKERPRASPARSYPAGTSQAKARATAWSARKSQAKPVPPLQERGWPYGFSIFSSPVRVA